MEREVTVVPEAGLHARPAATFVETVNEYDSDVTVVALEDGTPTGKPVDARSMLAVTGLGVEHGDRVRIAADGADAEAALDALENLLSTPEP
jgi:phosphocarrier protein HPr